MRSMPATASTPSAARAAPEDHQGGGETTHDREAGRCREPTRGPEADSRRDLILTAGGRVGAAHRPSCAAAAPVRGSTPTRSAAGELPRPRVPRPLRRELTPRSSCEAARVRAALLVAHGPLRRLRRDVRRHADYACPMCSNASGP
jgi:hypothetical protein